MRESPNSPINLDFADLENLRMHYASAGKGEKLVVLLHGFPEFWYSWREQLVALSSDFTVVAPDLRGYNLSDKPEGKENYEVEKLATDVVQLIDFLGFEKAFVAGHDWGAGVAWTLAANHPEHVEKLVCMQVPPASVWKKNQTLKQFFASWYMFFFQLPTLPEWLLSRDDYARLAHGLYSSTAEKGVFTREHIDEYKKAWAQKGALTAALNYYRANIIRRMFAKSSEPTPKFTMPTMFIYGEQDHAILPRTVKDVESAIDGKFKELRFPGSGHWVQQEKAKEVSASLKEFFRKP